MLKNKIFPVRENYKKRKMLILRLNLNMMILSVRQNYKPVTLKLKMRKKMREKLLQLLILKKLSVSQSLLVLMMIRFLRVVKLEVPAKLLKAVMKRRKKQ